MIRQRVRSLLERWRFALARWRWSRRGDDPFDDAWAVFNAGDHRGARDLCEREASSASAEADHCRATAFFHLASLFERDPQERVRWSRLAVWAANASGCSDSAWIYAKLHSNLAFSYDAIDDLEAAARHHELALKHVPTMMPVAHRAYYRKTAEAELTRLRARIAAREAAAAPAS